MCRKTLRVGLCQGTRLRRGTLAEGLAARRDFAKGRGCAAGLAKRGTLAEMHNCPGL